MGEKETLNIICPLSVSGESLFDLITIFPHPANIKDISNEKYILGNQATADICGLQHPEQLIGQTVFDLDRQIQSQWGNTYAQIIKKLDDQVKQDNKMVEDRGRIILIPGGCIRIQNMVKIPIVNHRKKTSFIFTYSMDITKNADLLYLFNLYKRIYLEKRVAIKHFLRYLEIDNYFSALLTEAEVCVLIAMKYSSSHKIAARRLKVQPKTIELHTSNIRMKLKEGSLCTLLEILRHEPTHLIG